MPQSSHARAQELGTNLIQIPQTRLRVSRIALGIWAIIDPAPAYGFGVSEEIVGEALKGTQLGRHAIVSTKVGLEWHDGAAYRNATPARMMERILTETITDRVGPEFIAPAQRSQ